MKIKIDFITNSSSSSYIITTIEIPEDFELKDYMSIKEELNIFKKYKNVKYETILYLLKKTGKELNYYRQKTKDQSKMIPLVECVESFDFISTILIDEFNFKSTYEYFEGQEGPDKIQIKTFRRKI